MSLEGTCGGITDFGCDNLQILDEGVAIGGSNTLNFVGSGVTATLINGIGTITVTGGGGGASTFDAIGSGTNTTAAMVVGTGATLAATGSGTIVATSTTGNAATVTTNANLTGPITSTGNATAIASQTGTGTKFVVDTSPTLVTPNIGTATGTGLILTSTAATAFVVGANGSTNPAFTVDASTASSATGVTIKSAAAGGGVALTALSSAASETIVISAKAASGPSFMTLTGTSWFITQRVQMLFASNSNGLTFQAEGTGNPGTKFVFNASSNDTPSAFTENNFISVGSSTSTWGTTGTLASNRTINIGRQFLVGSSGSYTITNASTMALNSGPPQAGNNMTLTNAHGIFIAAAAVTTGTGVVGDAYALSANAPTGATRNYAANFNGVVGYVAISAPGTLAEGMMWADSTQKAEIGFIDGIKQSRVGCIFTQTATQTIANTGTETSLFGTGIGTLTLPANFFVIGKTVRIMGAGVFSSLITPGNVTIKIKLGSTVIATGTITNILASASNNAFEFMGEITCRTTGASGTVMVNGNTDYDTGVLAQGTLSLNNAGATTTIDTTASQILDVTFTWATANASNTISTTTASVEVLN